jgi:alginate O-acetyltransferase complex protein AlgI
MVFSSNLFLFGFLPIFFLAYLSAPLAARNIVILVASLIFYTFGSGTVAWILIASVVLNDVAARWLVDPGQLGRKAIFVAAVVLNLLPLFYYKYFAFTIGALLEAGVPLEMPASLYTGIALPIGISFFTFQAISYLADVYNGLLRPPPKTVDYAVYHTLFPQLVAGPIVRYSEIENTLHARRFDTEEAAAGAYRFCIGLGKKVIVADNLAWVVDHVFDLPGDQLTMPLAWFAIACFSLQIYLDFSGYSDMAIGLGRILGFHFPENFDQPYRARNITEFWRRWHMTLTRWFRDYLYIPLGGNRKGNFRTYANLWLVFLLCGLWHGASAMFVIWGAYHGLLLAIERVLRNMFGWRPTGLAGTGFTVLLVTIGWVPFRSANWAQATHFLATMFAATTPSASYDPPGAYLNAEYLTYFAIAITVAFIPVERLRAIDWPEALRQRVKYSGAIAIALLAVAMLSVNGFRPFIYFQF